MRSLNPDRLMVSGGSASINVGMVLPSVDFGRVSVRPDDDLAGGLFRVGGGVAHVVASSAIRTTVMLSDGTRITFDTIAG
jgi:hypothetical protein